MAASRNNCTFIGNLGSDPEVRTAGSGLAICTFRIAVNERVKKDGEWTDHVEWVPVVCFGKTAEACGKFLAKGRQVFVEGRMQTRKWQDKEGRDRWTTEIVANDVQFLGSKGDGSSRSSGNDSNSGGGQSAADDSEIPF